MGVIYAYVNFSCREIKFTGTQLGVMVVAVIVLVWVIFWKERILSEIKNADMFQVVLSSMVFTYLITFLVQRGVFHHIPLLPNEEMASEGIEELLENVGHFLFFLLGLVAFYSLDIRRHIVSGNSKNIAKNPQIGKRK